ncbi:hypothetical protein OXX79_006767 [Metschnikowia pulcherrima]
MSHNSSVLGVGSVESPPTEVAANSTSTNISQEEGTAPGDSSPETASLVDSSWFDTPALEKFSIYSIKKQSYVETLPPPSFPEIYADPSNVFATQHIYATGGLEREWPRYLKV